MSLIVATSHQPENRGKEGPGQIPNERPSSFSNFFRSPISVEAGSEIAVESVKLNRTANVNIKDGNNFFCHYFGERMDDADDRDYMIHVPRKIQIDQKTYSVEDYIKNLQDKLNTQYGHPSIFNRAICSMNVNASTGKETGVKIQFPQRASGSGNDKTGNIQPVPYYSINTPTNFIINGPKPSNDFDWDLATTTFTRTVAATGNITTQNASCVAIARDIPFSNAGGRFDVNCSEAVASASYVVIGLSRPHIQYEEGPSENGSRTIKNLTPFGYQPRGNFRYYTGEVKSKMTEHYDFGILFDNTATDAKFQGVRIFQSMNNKHRRSVINGTIKHYELKYFENIGLTKPYTIAEFTAQFDAIRWQNDGGYLSLFFKNKGKATYTQILGPNLSKNTDRCFKPIGDTTYALYPQFNLSNGSLTVTKYESEMLTTQYLFPFYNASDNTVSGTGPRQYTPGSDMYSNNRLPFGRKSILSNGAELQFFDNKQKRALSKGSIRKVDNSLTYRNWHSIDPKALLAHFHTDGLNASGGVAYQQVLIVQKYNRPQFEDYLLKSQRFPNMSGELGFIDRSVVSDYNGSTEGYATGSGTNTVTFISPNELDKGATTSFIRIPTLTHQSFNGAQQSMSKIIYQVPEFSNDGRQYGNLYFAPGEKTYIDLNNPNKVMLNSLQVQIVGVDEKEINSLTGTTQVVLHVRKKR